jgi:hypothetical protein
MWPWYLPDRGGRGHIWQLRSKCTPGRGLGAGRYAGGAAQGVSSRASTHCGEAAWQGEGGEGGLTGRGAI